MTLWQGPSGEERGGCGRKRLRSGLEPRFGPMEKSLTDEDVRAAELERKWFQEEMVLKRRPTLTSLAKTCG